MQYYFKKCTSEVKHFVNKKEYEKISVEKDGILKYEGRILPSQKFDGVLKLSDVMLDLTSSTFSVPIVDKSSPFAFAVVNEIHWYHSVAAYSGNGVCLEVRVDVLLYLRWQGSRSELQKGLCQM